MPAACTLDRTAPARVRARPATATAVRSRRSPTRISCSGISPPTASSTAASASTKPRRASDAHPRRRPTRARRSDRCQRYHRNRKRRHGKRVRAVTTERGLDPRDFTLVVYGGAGPLHAVDVARELAIRSVIVPQAPGTFSAYGMQTADLRREYARTFGRRSSAEGSSRDKTMCARLRRRRAAWLRGRRPQRTDALEHAVDVRYIGQEHYSRDDYVEPGTAATFATSKLRSTRLTSSATATTRRRRRRRYRRSASRSSVCSASRAPPRGDRHAGKPPDAYSSAGRSDSSAVKRGDDRLRSRAATRRHRVRRSGRRPGGRFSDLRTARGALHVPAFGHLILEVNP